MNKEFDFVKYNFILFNLIINFCYSRIDWIILEVFILFFVLFGMFVKCINS